MPLLFGALAILATIYLTIYGTLALWDSRASLAAKVAAVPVIVLVALAALVLEFGWAVLANEAQIDARADAQTPQVLP